MFRGYIKRNPGGSQSPSLSPLITQGHNGKHLLPPYNAVQITCEHKCSSEQTLLCGSLPSLPQPRSESLFSLLSWPFVTWLWRINRRERSSMWLIPVRYMRLPDWSFREEEVNEMSLLVYLSSSFYLWSPAPVCRGAWRPFCKHNPNLHPRKTFWPRSLRQTESGASTAVNVDSLMITCITSAEVIYSSVQKHNLIRL